MSKVRVFQNQTRVATATYLKDGTILQVYPTKQIFATEAKFRKHWQDWALKALDFKHTDSAPTSSEKVAVEGAAAAPAATPVSTEGWTYNDKWSFTAPAGTYYIGDLCYALPTDLYDKVFGGLTCYSPGLYTKDEKFFIVDRTFYGDGCYKANDGNVFDVDAGIIGMAPISICDMNGRTRVPGGHIYTFEHPVSCRFRDGVFRFLCDGWDRLTINTVGNDEDGGSCCDGCDNCYDSD